MTDATDTARALEALPADVRADVEERAAIMEYDGGLSRGDAELAALRAYARHAVQRARQRHRLLNAGDESVVAYVFRKTLFG